MFCTGFENQSYMLQNFLRVLPDKKLHFLPPRRHHYTIPIQNYWMKIPPGVFLDTVVDAIYIGDSGSKMPEVRFVKH